ncbi:MAG: carbohydrate kinase [Desulfuromonas sp.]|nr:MAG: carbohydrate kinase [Desulfuromonas sp.]
MSLQSSTPLIFGEVLYDIFPDQSVLGGAPFNVCWHLAGFGLTPLFISRVGRDKLGEQVLQSMHDWGVASAGVQRDETHPTGRVCVSLRQGQPHYHIEENQAYDHITPDLHYPPYPNTPLLYHGTLALRSATNRNALHHLLATTQAPCFVDLNLRAPWWDTELICALLKRCRWAKMNAAELDLITPSQSTQCSIEERINHLATCFNIDHLIVTCGENGSYCTHQSDVVFHPSHAITNVVDTVGAGDAFSAVCIIGLLQNWATATLLRRASQFAARICTQRGALLYDQQEYADLLQQWDGTDDQ